MSEIVLGLPDHWEGEGRRLADTLESRIDRTLSMLLRLMEPAMLLVIAGIVMFIFLALVVPMMQLSSQL